jgi:BirA family biotin operon repressor/biotin-[acetyl-CoA-carboxylase] ligase
MNLRERLFWPAEIHHFEVLGSTNHWLREEARRGAPGWTVAIAARQTAGRGRLERPWDSGPGGLYLSVLVPLAVQPSRAGLVSLAVGVAVAEALEGFGTSPLLKWPNDVQIGGKKVAGLLLEVFSQGPELESAVVGVGVNVGNDLPSELRATATTLALELGQAPLIDDVAGAVLSRIQDRVAALLAGDAVVPAWKARSLPWWGHEVEVVSAGTPLRGIATGVDEGGALVLELPDGTPALVFSGDARQLRPAGTP